MGQRWIVILIISFIAIAYFISISGYKGAQGDVKIGSRRVLKIFHAGSLVPPLSKLEEIYESENPGVDIQREAAGSVVSIRKITELGRKADILASADYSIISKYMYPVHVDWNIQFARNEIVIAYTNRSLYASEIDDNNWYIILKRDNVRFGFSNPNDDPCGYRTMFVIALSDIYYNKSIFSELIERNTAIKMDKICSTICRYHITVPNTYKIDPNREKILMRSMEVELSSALETGAIDYFFIYRSIAVEHNFRFISLPDDVNLGSKELGELYSRVSLSQANGKNIIAKPILYGITIVKDADNYDDSVNFIKLVISERGLSVFREYGLLPYITVDEDEIDKIPVELIEYVG